MSLSSLSCSPTFVANVGLSVFFGSRSGTFLKINLKPEKKLVLLMAYVDVLRQLKDLAPLL